MIYGKTIFNNYLGKKRLQCTFTLIPQQKPSNIGYIPDNISVRHFKPRMIDNKQLSF